MDLLTRKNCFKGNTVESAFEIALFRICSRGLFTLQFKVWEKV
jgi:hypothetical protein